MNPVARNPIIAPDRQIAEEKPGKSEPPRSNAERDEASFSQTCR
jgi:hypothetical protein